jgi:hypothetical protein
VDILFSKVSTIFDTLSIFPGSTHPKEVEPPMRGEEIEDWLDPDFEFPNSQKGKYSPSAKTLVDKTALAFEEGHPDMRIVIFNPSMILGNDFKLLFFYFDTIIFSRNVKRAIKDLISTMYLDNTLLESGAEWPNDQA